MMKKTLTVATTVALAYTTIGLATPASATPASIAGFQRYEESSASDWTDVKTATATCPNGQLVHSTGARVDGGNGGVVLTDIEPNVALTSVTVRGEERTGHLGAWSITAFAVCAVNGGYYTDPVRVSSPFIGATTTATCPEGKTVTGVGFHLLNPADVAYVDKAKANDPATSVTVHVGGTALIPAARAYAVCSWLGYASDWRYTGAVEVNEISPKTATYAITDDPWLKDMVFCLGGEVTGGNNVAFLDHLSVTDSQLRVNARATRASAVGWTPIQNVVAKNVVAKDDGSGGGDDDFGAIVVALYADWY